MLCTQKKLDTLAPRVTGSTRCRLVAGYSTICPAGSFTECTPYVSSTLSSPPSYSSGAERNRVAETSVLILWPVVAFERIAVSTCVPKCPPPVYRLNIGGKTLSGSAADINSGDRASAPSTISPSFTATGCPSGSCRFSFTLLAWYPAVTLPSTHSAASSAALACATSPALNTSEIVISIVHSLLQTTRKQKVSRPERLQPTSTS